MDVETRVASLKLCQQESRSSHTHGHENINTENFVQHETSRLCDMYACQGMKHFQVVQHAIDAF